MGYTKVDNSDGNGNICTLTGNNSVSYVFTKINDEFESNGVVFDSGLSDANETLKDPFTYKLRGLYLDGINHLLTYDRSGSFYLSNKLTMNVWFHPTATTGTIFSKSFNDFTDSTTSKFFDVSIGSNGSILIEITHNEVSPFGNSAITTFLSAYDLNDWNHIGILVDFDKTSRDSTLQIVHNESIRQEQTVDDTFIMD
jgi:hypothetical protein